MGIDSWCPGQEAGKTRGVDRSSPTGETTLEPQTFLGISDHQLLLSACCGPNIALRALGMRTGVGTGVGTVATPTKLAPMSVLYSVKVPWSTAS